MTKLTNSQARAVTASARLIYHQLSDVAMVCQYDAVVVPYVSEVFWKSCVYRARGHRRGRAREHATSPKAL